MSKRVIVSVINDLVTDQRVRKMCGTLHQMGFDILLVGRQLKHSLPMDQRPYKVMRMRLLFTKGPLFYAEYNIRLFLLLMTRRFDLLVSNDLDTLAPNYLWSKWKNKPMVYDSHEYFTEVPELVNRRLPQMVWKKIEAWIFPTLRHVITVNDSIADLFEKDYHNRPLVIRNIPLKGTMPGRVSRAELGLPDDRTVLILQGSGINVDRGAEELVEAMQWVDHALLLIAGSGDVIPQLKSMVEKLQLQDKVVFRDRMPYERLMQYTMASDIGLTVDKDTNLNYRFSLPNKLFDYIQAGIPVLASRLPEIERIIKEYHIGDFIPDHRPRHMADAINRVISSREQINEWKNNCTFASLELNWEKEEEKVIELYSQYA